MKNPPHDFLKKYYRRLHVSAMDDEVLARLVDNHKKGLLTNEQESWFKDGFIVPDPNSRLGYKAAALPELNITNDITEDELKKLYQRCAAAMAGLKTDSVTYSAKDEEAKKLDRI